MIDWLERNRGYVLVTVINLVLVGGLFFWLRQPASEPIEILPPEPTPSPTLAPTPTSMPLRVYVTGAVSHPDVYLLAPGSIVKDAIEVAGGATQDADLALINLAQELRDQQQIYVPHMGEADAPPPVTGGERGSDLGELISGGKININTAAPEELETLPGIGPALAQRIVEHREVNGPFTTIEDITQVSGIGDATFEKLKDRITVSN